MFVSSTKLHNPLADVPNDVTTCPFSASDGTEQFFHEYYNVTIVPFLRGFVKRGSTSVTWLESSQFPSNVSHKTCHGLMCTCGSVLCFDLVMGSFASQRSFESFWRSSNSGPMLSLLRNTCGQLYTTRFLISFENHIGQTPLVHGDEHAFQGILISRPLESHVEGCAACLCRPSVLQTRTQSGSRAALQGPRPCRASDEHVLWLCLGRRTCTKSETGHEFLSCTRRDWCSWRFRRLSLVGTSSISQTPFVRFSGT